VTAVPFAVRFWHRIEAMAQGAKPLRTFRELLETTTSRGTTLRFVAAEMRRRIDPIPSHGEVVRILRQLFGNWNDCKRTLTFVVTGLPGLALVLILLLEISVRIELSREARNAAIDATRAPEMPQKIAFEDAFGIQPPSSTLLQSFDQLGAPGGIRSAGYAQTFGQVFQEPVPLPRTRKPH
jgi:hypothetical protein